jgi:hypothetical protein
VTAAFTLSASTIATAMGLLMAGIVAPPRSALPGGVQAAAGPPRAALAAPVRQPVPAKAVMPNAHAKRALAGVGAPRPGIGKGKPVQKRNKRRRPGPSGFLIKIE